MLLKLMNAVTIENKKILVLGGILKKGVTLQLIVREKNRPGYYSELEFILQAQITTEPGVELYAFCIPWNTPKNEVRVSISDILNLDRELLWTTIFAGLLKQVKIDLRINRTCSMQFSSGIKGKFEDTIEDDIDLRTFFMNPSR